MRNITHLLLSLDRLNEDGICARLNIGLCDLQRLFITASSRQRIGTNHQVHIRIAGSILCGVDLADHRIQRNDGMILKMTAALRILLILNKYRANV